LSDNTSKITEKENTQPTTPGLKNFTFSEGNGDIRGVS
jgi:hypothetical protein